MLLLLLADVLPDEIVADYGLSNRYMAEKAPRYCTLGVLERHRTTERDLLMSILEPLDAPGYLRAAGVTASEIEALRGRLFGG
jgi:hypothetical protein